MEENTEAFRWDRTRAGGGYWTDCIGVCGRISKAQDHSPRVFDHNKLLGVQVLTERLDVFNVCVQINGRRVIPWQLRSARSALLPHNAPVFFAKLVSDTLHRPNVFTRSTA